ncbi:hypothetical protein [Burkholderia sp. Bp9143]|uniref:hypothetical protein n=1 Tax=Burkholderia sp. Bp9143 TaxID=2184574 RepID=UPI000F58F73E|nr:hypothetical protein [Burkholderia sp. Bp9143]
MERNTATPKNPGKVIADQSSFSSISHPIGAIPLMTREAFAAAIGLPITVLVAQAERGYWPVVRVGKRVFINVELVRKRALEQEFVL